MFTLQCFNFPLTDISGLFFLGCNFWSLLHFSLTYHYVGVAALKIIEYRGSSMLVEVPLRDGPLRGAIFIQETKTAQFYRYQTTELNALRAFLDNHQEESLELEMGIYHKLHTQVRLVFGMLLLDCDTCAGNKILGQGFCSFGPTHHHGACGNH